MSNFDDPLGDLFGKFEDLQDIVRPVEVREWAEQGNPAAQSLLRLQSAQAQTEKQIADRKKEDS